MYISAFLLIIASFFICPFTTGAQAVSRDSLLIAAHIHSLQGRGPETRKVQMQKTLNPVKAILFLTMYLYQRVFSEQISAGCEFDRSCSGFSIKAIREFGIVKGVCLSADRLTRCNGQAQAESYGYLINHSNGKTIDEPAMYRSKD